MDDNLRELVALVKPPLRTPSSLDQQAVEAVYGVPLPLDLLEYVATFPDGIFQGYLRVFHPAEYGSVEELKAILELSRDTLRCGAADLDHQIAIHPEPGGLLPWQRSVGTGSSVGQQHIPIQRDGPSRRDNEGCTGPRT